MTFTARAAAERLASIARQMSQDSPARRESAAAHPLARALRRLLDAQANLDAALLAANGELAADLALEELSRAEEQSEAALAAWYVIGAPGIEVRELQAPVPCAARADRAGDEAEHPQGEPEAQ